MKIVIGVDGGQTTTLALVAALDGQVLGEGQAGPSNHVHEPGGPERLRAALTQSINGALKTAQAESESVVSVCLGMTGGATQARDFAEGLFPSAVVQSYDDMVTALAGATTGQPGVVVIAGTGSIAYGRLADGRDARAGGWGYLLGDEGSAYDIGRAALRAVCQGADGRGPHTQLSAMVLEQLQVADVWMLRSAIYSGQITRPQVAGLAALVGRAAQDQDAVALDLLASAGQSLAAPILAVINRLGEPNLPVYTTGGVFRAGDALLDPFRAALRARLPDLSIQPALFSPVIGALLLAFQAVNVPIDVPLLDKLRATMPKSARSKTD